MNRLIAVVLATFLPGAAIAASGEVTFLEGKASRTPAGGAKVALKLSGTVEKGDLVETGPATRLELTLPDKSVVRLGPSSKLKLDEAAFSDTSRDFKATLLLGKVWSKVSSVFGSERNFEVRTERAVAGVRGTIFRVDASKSKAVLVKVYAGTVAVAGQSPIPTAAPPKGERVQIAGPQQVSRQQWEKLVSAMMQVRVSAAGVPEEPKKFSEKDEAKDVWSAWNQQRDNAVE
jgi:hypothetical protein